MKRKLAFIRACCWIGVAADLATCVLLVYPDAAGAAFGIGGYIPDGAYIYASRIGASLMLVWTFLLAWTAMDPAGRRTILLLTVFPVLSGLLLSSVTAVSSGFIEIKFMLPLWIFYALMIPAYLYAYILTGKTGPVEDAD